LSNPSIYGTGMGNQMREASPKRPRTIIAVFSLSQATGIDCTSDDLCGGERWRVSV
jgi:hypothetical protein